MVLSTEWAQVEVVELSNDGNGLGFHLVGGRSTGVVVKHVVPGGAADHDGRLQPGDHLLQVGAVNVRGLSAEQVAGVVRAGGAGGGGARLLVARRGVPGVPPPPGTALVPTRLLHDAESLHAHLLAAATPPAPPELPPATAPDVELLAVRLQKNVYGLGITVAGYVCEREELCGIFVRSIIEGSSAERSAVRVNDRIVAVDGASLLPLSNPQAVAVLRATGVEVELLLERHLRGPKFEHLRLAAFPDDRAPSPDVSARSETLTWFPVPSEPEVSNTLTDTVVDPPEPLAVVVQDPAPEPAAEVIEIDLDSATTIDSAILETEGAGGPEPPELDPDATPEEVSRWLDALLGETAATLQARWTAALGANSAVIVADVRRAADGLGLSVEGTAQVVRGRERRARHYVRGLRAGGAAGAGGARRGDELLQANNAVLRGAPHATAVAALRALPAAARLVLARGEPCPLQPAPEPHHSPPHPPSPSEHSSPMSSPLPPSPEPPRITSSPLHSPLKTSVKLCSPEPTLTMTSTSTLSPEPPLTMSSTPPLSPEPPLRIQSPPPHSPEPQPVPPQVHALPPSPPRTPTGSSLTPEPPQTPTPSPSEPSQRSLSPLPCSAHSPQHSPSCSPPGSPLLAPVSGLALWHSEEELVELHKTAQGLGFSILDYQDPQHPGGTVIVVRGVVAGGAAAAAGRPRRGERVLSVNGASVRGAALAGAVAALKAAPPGRVRLGLARPRHDPPPSP